MIKFFRNIRYHLMNENKTGKYLKYAIGEIVLVVVGILIALYVSNWNQLNQKKSTELLYLTNLLDDLRDQHKSIETQLAQEQSFFEATANIIKDFEEDKSLELGKEFYKQATHLGARRTFVITDATYTDLISSGNISILQQAEFKNKLIKFYQELERVEKIIQNNNSLLVDQIYLPTFQEFGYEFYPDFPSVFDGNTTLHENMVLPGYETKLEEISRASLSKDENLLKFMNAINLRNTLAIGHFVFLKNAQAKTNELIEDLEAILSD